MLKISRVKRSTYYYHTKKRKIDKYAIEKEEIIELFNHHQHRYGYRRITDELRALGYIINHKTVLKLMKNLNLKGKQCKNGKYHSYKGEIGKIAENLLQRDFTSNKPFEKLTTDITQFNVCGEKVYLSPTLDLYNREIVSYSISLSPNMKQIQEMLECLFTKLPENAAPLMHSDQGWQYQHRDYQNLLKSHNIKPSMSRKGNCMDNSVMENFFGRLKVEMFYGEKFESVDAFIEKLHEYIYYYNNERISRKLKGMSPIQYRTHSQII